MVQERLLGVFFSVLIFRSMQRYYPKFLMDTIMKIGFPDSSVSKESVCNAGEPGSIPQLGRSTGEGIGYPLQYSWTSLVVSW